jgi:hypothetical protein
MKRIIIYGLLIFMFSIFTGYIYSVMWKEKEGTEVKLENCRRIWYWSGANSISQLAVDGVTRPSDCKFTLTVSEIVITDVIEIIPCTDKAIENIEGVKEWRR